MAHQRHFDFHCKNEDPLQKAVGYKTTQMSLENTKLTEISLHT